MRIKGTKYPVIKNLPAKAVPVSLYAATTEMAVGSVYIKYDRHIEKGLADPGYIIRQYIGTNYIIEK